MRTRRAFTLVELMAVVIIIGILAMIAMRLMVYVNEKTAKTRTARDIEQIKHALTEFHATYGIYPPVKGMAWEYEKDIPPAKPDNGMGYYDGCAKYLYGDAQTPKWIHFVEELKGHWTPERSGSSGSAGNLVWSNNLVSITDPWGRDYKYETSDPYQSFKLYSLGPDGIANTADDVGNKWTE